MSEWMNGPLYKDINKSINKYLKLEKDIQIQFFPIPITRKLNKDLEIYVLDNNHKVIEKKYINPRKKINKNFNNLSNEDNAKLRDFLNTCGMDLLEYYHKKINFGEITKKLGNVFNK